MDRPTKLPKEALAYVEYLEKELKKYTESPYVKTYLTIYNQLNSFNDQLEIKQPVTVIAEDGTKKNFHNGFIDLFAEKDDKSFDRTKWYFEKVLELNKNLDELRKLMSAEQKKELDEGIKLVSGSTAEQHIFASKK